LTSWFVLSARYGHEERLRQAMLAAGCDAWYPREMVRVRLKQVEMPLDRYVFICAEAPLSAELWHAAGDCEGFRTWLGGEEPTALRPGELEVWREGFDGLGVLDEAAAARLRRGWDVGDTVMVVRGLYAGMVGRVERLRKNNLAEIKIIAIQGAKASISLAPSELVRVLVSEDGEPDAVKRGSRSTIADGELRNNDNRRRGQGRRKFLRKRKH
jgi:transcription antitermination factor NusG